jgi:uncharacterized beta-barrel protein YwiB (DUF1934 family)
MINVVVAIIGTQSDSQGEKSQIELITAGRCYNKENVKYIVYKDSEISGLEGVTTIVKVYEKHVVLVRTGSVHHKQEFHLGEKSDSTYVTSYGTMQMSVLTKSLEIAFTSEAGRLNIEYDLEINGEWQSANTLSISVREEIKSGYERIVTKGDLPGSPNSDC